MNTTGSMPVGTTNTVAGTPVSQSNSNSQLGQNAFLKLLVAQMQNQDPLKPQGNSQMLAQLAQFSSLEQMTNVASTETKMLSAIQSLQTVMTMAYDHQLIGTQVTVNDSQGNPISGQVSSIAFKQGSPQVVVGGTAYPMAQVVSMS